MAERVLITGGTGLVGKQLQKLLTQQGHEVCLLSRTPKGKPNTYQWDVDAQTLDPAALANTTAIVHLAGASVAEGSWTEARKREIMESRTKSSALLVRALQEHPHAVKTFVSASASGYYGNTGEAWAREDSTLPGTDFLAEVCIRWEESVAPVEAMGIRLVKLRIGVVLSAEGGALPKLVAPVKLFAGAHLGDGDQYMPWIHSADLCGIIQYALGNTALSGVYNAVAPNPVTNRTMTQAIGKQLGRPVWGIGVPSFVLKTALGEMAQIVLGGNRLSADKIQEAGYTFAFGELHAALANLLK